MGICSHNRLHNHMIIDYPLICTIFWRRKWQLIAGLNCNLTRWSSSHEVHSHSSIVAASEDWPMLKLSMAFTYCTYIFVPHWSEYSTSSEEKGKRTFTTKDLAAQVGRVPQCMMHESRVFDELCIVAPSNNDEGGIWLNSEHMKFRLKMSDSSQLPRFQRFSPSCHNDERSGGWYRLQMIASERQSRRKDEGERVI